MTGALALSLAFGALALDAEPALAQAAPTPSAVQRADAAFDEGRELFDQGRFKEACEKFQVSMDLDPSPGTLLNLGNCYEPQGDLVRSLATFERAFTDAQKSPDAKRRELWTNAARERISALSPRVPELTVRGAPEGSQATLDGEPIETGRPVRVNPGRHQLKVVRGKQRPFEQTLDIAVSQRLAVEVPEPEPDVAPTAPVLTAPPVEPEAPPAVHRSFGPWPYILGGTGVALLGTSLITGLSAKSKANELESECGDKVCGPELESVKDSAATLGLVTDVLWISGAVVAGVGVTLFVLDTGESDHPATAFQTGCFEGGCGLIGSGRF